MSVYTELVKIGLSDDAATEVADAVHRTEGLVTVHDLDLRIAKLEQELGKLEVALTRSMITTMIALTGIYAFFVAMMTWVLKQ
jgi:hypothetical protein